MVNSHSVFLATITVQNTLIQFWLHLLKKSLMKNFIFSAVCMKDMAHRTKVPQYITPLIGSTVLPHNFLFNSPLIFD